MDTRPDYRLYHLRELHDALSNIDEVAFPEEAKIIKEYIAKGGYAYPREQEVIAVRFHCSAYKWAVVGYVAWLLVWNLHTLVFNSVFLALIPVSVQGAVLVAIGAKHKWTKTLVKTWAALLMVAGFFGGLALSYAEYPGWADVMDELVTFASGLGVFWLADSCIELVLASSNQPLESTR